MLGLALGDALGAVHEGGLLARLTWRVLGIGKGRLLRYTDDTEMALVLTRSLATRRGVDSDALAREWAEQARWTRGYGRGTLRLLARVRRGEDWRTANRSVFRSGSYGNGAAMRAAPLGLWFRDDPEALTDAARLAASITHAHPLGIEGGVLVAHATAMALRGPLDLVALRERCVEEAFRSRLEAAVSPMDPDAARRRLGNSIRADESVVTALHAATRFDEFLPMIEWITAVGGDTDTIGAMAGAVYGARHGIASLPVDLLARVEARGDIDSAARALHAAAQRGD
jgi:ADP-ribosylglycohydrolase